MKPKILRAPQKSDLSPLQLKVGIVLILVAALIISGVYLNYQSTGQAISFRQGLQQVNLVKYGELEIRAPPTGALLLFLNTSISSAQEELIYRFILQKRDESSFTVILINNETNTLIAQDILFPGGSSSLIYLSDTDTLPDLEGHEDELMDVEHLNDTEDEFDFSSLEDFDEKLPETAILDKEEVEEVQGLLEETEEENSEVEEDAFAQEIGEMIVPQDENLLSSEMEDEFSFDDDLIPQEIEGEILNFDTALEDARLSQEDELPHKEMLDEDDFDDIEFSAPLEENTGEEEDEELLSLSEEPLSNDEDSLDEMDLSSLMDDDELGDLESKIEFVIFTICYCY